MPVNLIRSTEELESQYRYEMKTDVWVFADRAGYGRVIEQWREDLVPGELVPLAGIPEDSPGMHGTALLVPSRGTGRPALRAIERPVCWRGRWRMQLILAGNRAGFARLAEIAGAAMATGLGPCDHWHCNDEDDRWVVKRSVSLNFRGAVTGWDAVGLQEYKEDFRTGGRHQFPETLDFLCQDELCQDEYRHDRFPDDIVDWLSSSLERGGAPRGEERGGKGREQRGRES